MTRESLIKIAQAKYNYLNKKIFSKALPKVDIKVRMARYNGIEASLVTYFFALEGKPSIEIHHEWITDEVMLHEMTHLYLYLQYLPSYKLSGQKPADAREFHRMYAHTREFRDFLRKAKSELK